jgi:tyrosyl-tRNA synthetase
VKKMKNLQEAGFKIKILLADLHAYLNGKGSLEEIKEISEYNKQFSGPWDFLKIPNSF